VPNGKFNVLYDITLTTVWAIEAVVETTKQRARIAWIKVFIAAKIGQINRDWRSFSQSALLLVAS
jgi:hypothetical protein